MSGLSPFCQARSKVGAMTKKVMNSDRLMRTRLAGALCRPRPERRNESATMNCVKLVTIMRRPGARKTRHGISSRSTVRKRDDESREARDHYEEARRDRKDGQNRDEFDDAAARRGAAGGNQGIQVDALSRRRTACRQERNADADDSSHCTTKVRMTNACTLPPLRVAARSLRSWRVFSSPIGPSSGRNATVRRYARTSSPI